MLPIKITRIKAFFIHFLISVSIFIVFSSLVYWGWYPEPFLELQGGLKAMAVLLIVGVISGPIMTLILFKPGKWGLKFDITVVALLQAVAFLYGASVIYGERPVYLAFVKDRFEVITAGNIDFGALQIHELDNRFGFSPRLVYVKIPDDSKIRQQVLFESVFGGKDYGWRPEYYQSFPGPVQEIRDRALSIERFTEKNRDAKKLEDFLARCNLVRNSVILFPLVGRIKSMTAILKAEDAQWIGVIEIDPYL